MIAPFQASHNGIRKSHGFYQEQHQIFIFRRWVSYNFSHCRFISTLCFLFRLLSAPKEIAVDMMLTKDFSIVKVLRWTLYDFRELSSLVKHFLPCYISALQHCDFQPLVLINYSIQNRLCLTDIYCNTILFSAITETICQKGFVCTTSLTLPRGCATSSN